MPELLDLPELVLDHIFSHLTYDEIARNRIVCRRFNEMGWHLLNKGFVSAEKFQNSLLKAVKALLPRRESERRKHPLSKKCDVLMAIETRLSMLSMAFSRFVESKQCCFIPGKVIDELFRVMRSLDFDSCKEQQAPHQILQELRDVSTMAIEYFDEKISPILRKKEMMALTNNRGLSVFDMPCEVGTTLKIDTGRFDLNFGSRALVHRQSVEKMVKECCARMMKKNEDSFKSNRKWRAGRKILSSLTRVVRKQERTIKELQETVAEQAVRLSNNDVIINDLKRQQDEWKNCRMSSNFADLSKGSKRKSCSTEEEKHCQNEFGVTSTKKRKVMLRKSKKKPRSG